MNTRLAIALFSLTGGPFALACEPCPVPLADTATAIREANLVAIVESFGDAKGGNHQGPKLTSLKVKRVLKGKYEGTKLEAKAWYGMCDYGFVLDSGTYLAFFAKEPDGWAAVRHGCAPKALPIVNGVVDDNGRKVAPAELVGANLR